MSQKRQVKKVLPFTVLPKWRIGSSLTRSCIFKECLRVVLECLKTSGNICWLNVCFFLVFGCLEGCFNLSGWYFGMPELLGGVRGCFWRPTPWGIQWDWSQLTNVVQPWKTRFFSPDAFQTSKYQNQTIYHFQKWLSFAIFIIFHNCQRKITIYSLFGSPCITSLGKWGKNWTKYEN